MAKDWTYDVVSIGYPGRFIVVACSEPHNLAPGWVGFDFEAAFDCPVKLLNDAAMQALGSYKGGTLLFLGPGNRSRFRPGGGRDRGSHGTGPPFLPERTYEDHIGNRGLKRLGKKNGRNMSPHGVARLIEAVDPDEVVLGGGNAKKLRKLPPGCRLGDNANAFLGGFRLWDGNTRRIPLMLLIIKRQRKEPSMTAGIARLSERQAWKALAAHHKNVRELHLRKLFADDPKRGERMTVEAVGLYLDYSKNRITDETLKLLFQLAKECGLRERIDAMFRGEKINITENRAVLHVALRAPKGASIVVDGENVVPRGPRGARQDD